MSITTATSTPSSPVTTATAGDFDGDGNVDLAAVNVTGNTDVILFGNGEGGFATPFSIPATATSGAAGYAVAGDLTGDGLTDLVTTGAFSAQLNFFAGSKAPTTTTVTSPTSGREVAGTVTFTSSTADTLAWAKPGGTVTLSMAPIITRLERSTAAVRPVPPLR
jgi:hypothetical protein